jgi:hypothetical protein
MASVPDPLKSLGFSDEFLAARRARYVAEDAHFDLATVRCGVVFFMAFWSGYARLAFAELKRVLGDIDPRGRLELVVVDVDGCTQLCELPGLGIRVGMGYGEMAWIREGQTVSVTPPGTCPKECYTAHTRSLLEMCTTE